MKCPKCDTSLTVTHQALAAENLTFTLAFEGDMMMARTLGGCLTDIDKLLTAEARHLGIDRPGVFLTSLVLEPHKAEVGLLVASGAAKREAQRGRG